jgi:hypothetical protein
MITPSIIPLPLHITFTNLPQDSSICHTHPVNLFFALTQRNLQCCRVGGSPHPLPANLWLRKGSDLASFPAEYIG